MLGYIENLQIKTENWLNSHVGRSIRHAQHMLLDPEFANFQHQLSNLPEGNHVMKIYSQYPEGKWRDVDTIEENRCAEPFNKQVVENFETILTCGTIHTLDLISQGKCIGSLQLPRPYRNLDFYF